MARDQRSPKREARGHKRSRQAIGIRAVLHAHGTRRRVQILDYSRRGLRLGHTSGIALDEHVTVELGSGLRLPMRVVYVSEDSTALRFLGTIAPGLTVMRALDAAARG